MALKVPDIVLKFKDKGTRASVEAVARESDGVVINYLSHALAARV